MDPIAIILTIAACIGGLVLLYLIAAVVMFKIASKQAKKTFDEFDNDFGSHFRR